MPVEQRTPPPVNHLADLDSIDLPAAFGRALLADASCEAVLVESTAPGTPTGRSGSRSGSGSGQTGRRGSVVLFRVGEAFVAEVVGIGGSTRFVGLSPVEAEAYLDRVDSDERWTALRIEGSLASRHGVTEGPGTSAGP